jgi:hypothetical protein
MGSSMANFFITVSLKSFKKTVSGMLDLIGDEDHIILGINDKTMSMTLVGQISRVSEMLWR